jgi:microcystin-dependent protein
MNKFIEYFKIIILIILVILVINLYLCKGKEEHMTTDVVNNLPKGTIVAYNSTIAPNGWALCDGNNGTPNLNNRFILGSGSKSINTTGGVETVTLNVNELPSHIHNVSGSTNYNGNHHHNSGIYYGRGYDALFSRGMKSSKDFSDYIMTSIAGNHNHNFNVNSESTGGNQPHENMPPFYVLTYIMKL